MNASQRAQMVRLLACDLCSRVEERGMLHNGGLAGYDFAKGEGLSKTQIHADIVQLRRMLALLDKEVMG